MPFGLNIPPALREALFRIRHPGAKAGYPSPSGAELHEAIGRELGYILRPYELNADMFWKFKSECGYAERYTSYMGPDLLNEKLLEHFVSLELLRLAREDVLIDVGSAASPFSDYAAGRFGCKAYTLDLAYPPGVHENRIGCRAERIPMPDNSVSALTLHCTIDHLEGDGDSLFIREAARILRPGGRVCILPVYFTSEPANLCDPRYFAPRARFDPEARIHAVRGYNNRFGRFYSPKSFQRRIVEAAAGMKSVLYHIAGDQPKIPNNYLHYALIMGKGQ